RPLSQWAGRVWIANDGGVARSEDTGSSDPDARIKWASGNGLSTLIVSNVTALDRPGGSGIHAPLFMGTGDNYAFLSLDGGDSWQNLPADCGDCGWTFSDAAISDRVVMFTVARPAVYQLRNDGSGLEMARSITPPPGESNIKTEATYSGY